MRIVIAIFLIITLTASVGIWKVTQDTRLLKSRIKNTEKEITSLKVEARILYKYKDEKALSLEKFYLQVFNDIKEVSFYYHASIEIKVLEAKDLVSLFEFFKSSQYRGIRYIDVKCQVNLKDLPDMYLFETLYKIIKNRPIDILEMEMGKDVLNLTMRLYGP